MESDTGISQNTRVRRLILFGMAALVLMVIVRRAWMSDDAHITLRVVDNFLHGYGLTWNVTERVQVYTHPLWMLLLNVVIFFTREYYLTPIFLGIFLTGLCGWLLVRQISLSWWGSVFAMLILLLSKAFVDYATSGLENALSYALIAAFFAVFLRNSPSWQWLAKLSFLAALGLVTRMDLGLLLLPALLYAAWRVRGAQAFAALALGMLPFLAWEAFSIIYYGFPFANTAYAKLNTGITQSAYLAQGVWYLLDSLRFDPITLLTLAASSYWGWRTGSPRVRLLVMGALLYVLYVIQIGGDFMSGRFLSVPLVCAVIALTQVDFSLWRFDQRRSLLIAIGVVGLGLSGGAAFPLGHLDWSSRNAYYADWKPFIANRHGIVDERDFYAAGTSLLKYHGQAPYPDFPWVHEGLELRKAGPSVVVRDTIGMTGLFAGPQVHIVDPIGLADALLAHLPAKADPHWRIGHFERDIPAGYLESIRQNDNQIQDPHIRQMYAEIRLITQGDLFDPARLEAIRKMNLGR